MDSNISKALLIAIRQADIIRARKVLNSNGLTLNEDWTDYMLLVNALQKRRVKIATLLIDEGCRVRNMTKTNFFHTPLYYATKLNNIELVEKLLIKGASITDKDRNRKTSLCFAMDNKYYDIVDLMLSKYDFDNMNAINDDEIAHFHIACKRNNLKIMKAFIDHGMSINSGVNINSNEYPGYTALHFAVNNLSTDAVNFLLKNGASLTTQDKNGLTPLHLAYFKNHKDEQLIHEKNGFFNMELALSNDKLRKLKKESIINRLLFVHSELSTYVNPVDQRGISHFHIACARDTWMVKMFLEFGVDVNKAVSLDSDQFCGYSPLHIAVENNRMKTINLLLRNGAKINAKAKNGVTSLHLAVKYDKIKIVEILLKNHANVNIKDDEGSTALHWAFEYIHPYPNGQILDLLLNHCSVTDNPLNCLGLSHFHIACTRSNINVVQSFLKQGIVDSSVKQNTISWSGFTALHFAVFYNQKSNVELLLKYDSSNISYNSKNHNKYETALHLACLEHKKKIYNLVEKYELTLNKNKNQCSKIFDWNQNCQNQILIIEMLLKLVKDINVKNVNGQTLLMCAYDCNIDSLVENFILSLHIKDDKNREYIKTSIREEIYARREAIIRILLKYNADVNIPSPNNETVLYSVCSKFKDREAAKLAELFLSKGASVNFTNDFGLTPLHQAIKQRNIELIKVLLKYNADVNYVEPKKLTTPLHIATLLRDEFTEPITKMLLSHNANPNFQEIEGQTPLHNLASYKNNENSNLYECLFNCESNLDIQDKDGCTPIHLACKKNNVNAVYELLRYGADINVEQNHGDIAISYIFTSKILSICGLQDGENQNDFLIQEYIDKHVKKLIAAGFYVNRKVRNYAYKLHRLKKNRADLLFPNFDLDTYPDDKDEYFIKCKTELKKMKNISINNYSTLYDILYKDQQEMAKLIKNINFTQIINSESFVTDFPVYEYLIKLQYKRGLLRNVLLAPAKKSLELLSRLGLPDSCSEQIFMYLDNHSLRNLIKAKKVMVPTKRKYENINNDNLEFPSKVLRVDDRK